MLATIDAATGAVTGVAAGTTTVTAESEGVTDAAILVVSQVPVDSVLVTPGVAEVRVGGVTTFTAAVFDSTGAELTGRTVTWSIQDPSVATIDPATGEVTGVSQGATIVTATSEGVTDLPVVSVVIAPDSAEVRVGGQTTYSASAFDSTGAPLTGRTVTWSILDPAVASRDPLTGAETVVTGLAPGRTILSATSEGITDSAIIGVSPVPVDSVAVAPDTVEVRVGEQGQFAASVFDSTGAPLTDRTVTWASLDPAVASIDAATGLVSGVAEGTTVVTATSEGITGQGGGKTTMLVNAAK